MPSEIISYHSHQLVTNVYRHHSDPIHVVQYDSLVHSGISKTWSPVGQTHKYVSVPFPWHVCVFVAR